MNIALVIIDKSTSAASGGVISFSGQNLHTPFLPKFVMEGAISKAHFTNFLQTPSFLLSFNKVILTACY